MSTILSLAAFIVVCLAACGLLGHLLARFALWLDERAAKKRNRKDR